MYKTVITPYTTPEQYRIISDISLFICNAMRHNAINVQLSPIQSIPFHNIHVQWNIGHGEGMSWIDIRRKSVVRREESVES